MIRREISVIEGGIGPHLGVVSGCTGRWELRRRVIRVRCIHIIGLMAAITICRQSRVVVVDMAASALQRCMCASKWESSVVVIEACAVPVGGAVAGIAGGWEPGRRVVGIGGSLVVLEVAGHASRIRTGQVVVAVDMTLRTLQRCMCSCERKTGGRVIETATAP